MSAQFKPGNRNAKFGEHGPQTRFDGGILVVTEPHEQKHLEQFDLPDAKLREFLDGLTALTAKTGIQVTGCGCCGSPWLENHPAKSGKYMVVGNDLKWVVE